MEKIRRNRELKGTTYKYVMLWLTLFISEDRLKIYNLCWFYKTCGEFSSLAKRRWGGHVPRVDERLPRAVDCCIQHAAKWQFEALIWSLIGWSDVLHWANAESFHIFLMSYEFCHWVVWAPQRLGPPMGNCSWP